MAPRRLRHFTQEPSLVSLTALSRDKSATDSPPRAKHSHVEELISPCENPLGWRPPASPCDNRLWLATSGHPQTATSIHTQASSFNSDLSLPLPVTFELACTNSFGTNSSPQAPVCEPKHLAVVARDPLSFIWPRLAGVLASRRPTTPASQHHRFAYILATIPLHPVSTPASPTVLFLLLSFSFSF
jgi:hypothetical protein